MRFKPKKIKKNTQGEEELEEEDEEIDQLAGTAGNTYSYLAAEEEDYIENANNELIKGNEKFMKDLKKKYEALAKLRAEMSPKKKEEKAPAEKKVAVEPADWANWLMNNNSSVYYFGTLGQFFSSSPPSSLSSTQSLSPSPS